MIVIAEHSTNWKELDIKSESESGKQVLASILTTYMIVSQHNTYFHSTSKLHKLTAKWLIYTQMSKASLWHSETCIKRPCVGPQKVVFV